MASMIGGIIGITIGAILLASVFMVTIKSTNTSSWDAGEVALWSVLGLIGIAGLIYGVASVFGIAA